MMKNWNSAVDKFLDEWKSKKWFEGALLSGSYAAGTQSRNSDVDIMIVLSDKIKWQQRGNLVVDGFLLEYIANPASLWRKSFEDDFKSGKKVWVSMFAIGKVLFDKNGLVVKLKEEAEDIIKKTFRKMDTKEIEMAKFHLWDGLNKLESLSEEGFSKYSPLYYLHLSKIINFYASFVRISIPAVSKLYRFLNDPGFRNKYKMEGFSDRKFIYMVNDCLEDYLSLTAIERLNQYVIEKMGGFEIDGWTFRTKFETK